MNSNNNKPITERLDDIFRQTDDLSRQTEQILSILKDFDINHQDNKNNSNNSQLAQFIKASKKYYLWFGDSKDFAKSKKLFYLASIANLIIGFITMILSISVLKMYSTFTLFENIWMFEVILIIFKVFNLKRKMLDIELENKSTDVFVTDADNLRRMTNDEKKRYKIIRRIAYFSVIANIMAMTVIAKTGILLPIIFEIVFLISTIFTRLAYIDIYCQYGTHIIFTNKAINGNKIVSLVYEKMSRKLMTYEEFITNGAGQFMELNKED